MRWSYVGPRLVLVGLLWAFFALAFDPLLRHGLLSAGRTAAGATVEMGRLTTGFFPPSLVLRDVQVADHSRPDTNLVQFDTLRLQLAGDPLLRGAVVIHQGEVTGLRWDTPRAVAGRRESRPSLGPLHTPAAARGLVDALRSALDAPADAGMGQLRQRMHELQDQWDPRQLETVRTAETLRAQWTERFEQLDTRTKALQAQIDTLDDRAKGVKGNLAEKLEGYSQLAADVQRLLSESEQVRTAIKTLIPQAQQDIQTLDAARGRDMQRVQQQVRQLTSLDADALSRELLGNEILARVAQAAAWLRWTGEKTALLRGGDEIEPIRGRGMDVVFPRRRPLPGFLVESLTLSGEARIDDHLIPFRGTLRDATTNPVLHGRPTTLQLAGQFEETHIDVTAVDDRTGTVPVRSVSVSWDRPQPLRVRLGRPEDLAVVLAAAQSHGRADLRLTGNELAGELTLHQEGVTVDLCTDGERSELLDRMVQAAVKDIRHVELTVQLSGSTDAPQWTLRSNLGPQLAAGLQTFAAQELDRHRAEVAQRIDTTTQEQLAGFRAQLTDHFSGVDALISGSETKARALIDRLADRPLDLRGINLRGLLRR